MANVGRRDAAVRRTHGALRLDARLGLAAAALEGLDSRALRSKAMRAC